MHQGRRLQPLTGLSSSHLSKPFDVSKLGKSNKPLHSKNEENNLTSSRARPDFHLSSMNKKTVFEENSFESIVEESKHENQKHNIMVGPNKPSQVKPSDKVDKGVGGSFTSGVNQPKKDRNESKESRRIQFDIRTFDKEEVMQQS